MPKDPADEVKASKDMAVPDALRPGSLSAPADAPRPDFDFPPAARAPRMMEKRRSWRGAIIMLVGLVVILAAALWVFVR